MMTKKYLILYYLAFIVTVLFFGYSLSKSLYLFSYYDGGFSGFISNAYLNTLGIINLLLVIIFTVLLLKKKKINVENIVFPIVYICFFVTICILCFLFNNKVMVMYIHFEYYLALISVGYLFFNIYSLLSIKHSK